MREMMKKRGGRWLLILATVCGVALLVQSWQNSNAGVSKKPTLSEAQSFMKTTEANLRKLMSEKERTEFVYRTYLTHDTKLITTWASEKLMAYVSVAVKNAQRFKGLKKPADLARKFKLLTFYLSLPAPSDAKLRKELASTAAFLTSVYGKGKYCMGGDKKKCYSLGRLTSILAKSRNYDELLEVWKGWRTISPKMRKRFERFVVLANMGAKEMGYKNLGHMWRSNYDMSPKAFEKETERLWQQVKPLYKDLHCYVRGKLAAKYGKDKVPLNKPIPAHLLGNMWSQSWENIYPLVAPSGKSDALDVTGSLKSRKFTRKKMVRTAEGFFVSLGMPKLPKTFWKRSLFRKPLQRDVVCHASAWHIDFDLDVRIKQCVKINESHLSTLHHELGHIYYYLAYNKLPVLFQSGAHDGFHEAIGDLIALSITPGYLKKVNILPPSAPDKAGLDFLMKMALDKVAFLPFGRLIDQWRWDVFSGKVNASDYNKSWWKLRTQYQGIVPPVSRSEADFDPGAKYHIPANVPYMRYFLATILQFQFHRTMCKISGHKGPLHACSIYGNKKAGAALRKLLQKGQGQPWPETLKMLTGKKQMDATAILAYFAPLRKWLKKQNKGQRCGW